MRDAAQKFVEWSLSACTPVQKLATQTSLSLVFSNALYYKPTVSVILVNKRGAAPRAVMLDPSLISHNLPVHKARCLPEELWDSSTPLYSM